ncbi:hypothetical protein GCM10009733_020570 [Nonomuraea maheshkhaliensis]|uniref:Uncharacterized protein n=1 Tax=Nonomuraea maheshkhaliensis TaxID=419590 RepID=A0ABN2EZJ8_9ACTN
MLGVGVNLASQVLVTGCGDGERLYAAAGADAFERDEVAGHPVSSPFIADIEFEGIIQYGQHLILYVGQMRWGEPSMASIAS